MNCKQCNIETEDINYVFCSIKCQFLYNRLVENRKMNHSFVGGGTDKGKCTQCGFNYIAHTNAANCESCNAVTSCDVIDSILMCPDCALKSQSAQFDVIEENKQELVKQDINNQIDVSLEDESVEGARKIDANIRYNGDLFNAKTVAIIEVKKRINADTSIENKELAFQNELASRIEHLQKVVFELNNEAHDKQVEILANKAALREFGNALRAEIRERIKASDSQYVPNPNKPVARPVIKKVTKSPFERMAEIIALEKKITIEQAKDLLMKGGFKQ